MENPRRVFVFFFLTPPSAQADGHHPWRPGPDGRCCAGDAGCTGGAADAAACPLGLASVETRWTRDRSIKYRPGPPGAFKRPSRFPQ